MSEFGGKQVKDVQIGATDPEYSSRENEGIVLIHFTDGSALRVIGSSDEEVCQDVDLIDATAVRAYQRAAQGRRERERIRALSRQGWMALPCEERTRCRNERLSKMGAFARAVTVETEAMVDDMRRGSVLPYYGTIKSEPTRCPNCHEFDCPSVRPPGK